jgi:hypothetical protein
MDHYRDDAGTRVAVTVNAATVQGLAITVRTGNRFPESAATMIDGMSLETLRRLCRDILALASRHRGANGRVFG